MATLNILEYPDPRLHKIAAPVPAVTPEIKQLVRDMAETMYAAPGIGLAATQVDVHKRVIVIDVSTQTVKQDTLYGVQNGAVSELKPQAGSLLVPIIRYLVGTKQLTKAPTANGWGCLTQGFAADAAIALSFVAPTVTAPTNLALLLTATNAGGQGASVSAIGTW